MKVSYVDSNLLDGERIVRRFEWHWVCMIGVYILYFLSIITFGALLPIALIVHLVVYLGLKSSEAAITDQRLIMKVGLIKRETLECPLDQITQIRVSQGILERFVNSGKLVFKVDGEEHSTKLSLKDPNLVKQSLAQAVSDYKKHLYSGAK